MREEIDQKLHLGIKTEQETETHMPVLGSSSQAGRGQRGSTQHQLGSITVSTYRVGQGTEEEVRQNGSCPMEGERSEEG